MLQEIIKNFNEKKIKVEFEQQEIELKIEKLQKRLEKVKSKRPYVVQNVLIPLAKEIKSRCGFKAFEIYGPFGITGETSIYFSNNGKDGDIKICEVETWSLTLQWAYDNHNYLHHLEYWTGEKTNDYPKGSIGEMNGLNNIYKELPMDIDAIIKLLRHTEKGDK